MTFSANQFPDLYAGLDYVPQSSDDFGCIMLDVKPFEIESFVDWDYTDDLYYSPNREFVQGLVLDEKSHITLLFGLLSYGTVIRDKVDRVLADWKQPRTVRVDHVGVFPSYGEEKYSCIVAHIVADDALQEGHDRLRMLPHVDGFPEYKPHMTIAYVKPEATTEWLEALEGLSGQHLTVKAGLNYGK